MTSPRQTTGDPARATSVIAVMVADDHPIVRRGIVQILSDTPDTRVVAEAGSAAEALAHLRSTPIDVLVLDVAMPGAAGLALLEAVHRERPNLPVLMLSMDLDDQYAVRALRAGAAGYLTKESAIDDLVQAIRHVSEGDRWIPPRLAEHPAVFLDRGAERPPHELLSNREYEVLRRIGRGQSVKDIGRELCLSEKTVSTYRTRVLQKLGLRTTVELIRYAMQHELAH